MTMRAWLLDIDRMALAPFMINIGPCPSYYLRGVSHTITAGHSTLNDIAEAMRPTARQRCVGRAASSPRACRANWPGPASTSLDVAARLCSESGQADVRMEDLADAANASIGLTFDHFGSKGGVFLALAERALDDDPVHLSKSTTSSMGSPLNDSDGSWFSSVEPCEVGLNRTTTVYVARKAWGPASGSLASIATT